MSWWQVLVSCEFAEKAFFAIHGEALPERFDLNHPDACGVEFDSTPDDQDAMKVVSALVQARIPFSFNSGDSESEV
jgi:hypothetical protein